MALAKTPTRSFKSLISVVSSMLIPISPSSACQVPEYTTTSNMQGRAGEVLVYPNPARDKIYVAIEGDTGKYIYSIYSATGIICKKGDFNTGAIDISELGKGIYILELTGDEGIQYIQKFCCFGFE